MLEATRQRMRDFVALKAMPAWMGRCLVATGLINWYTDFFQIASKSTTKTLEELTDNAALRAVLSYNFGKLDSIKRTTVRIDLVDCALDSYIISPYLR